MSISYGMQSLVGCITIPITNTLQFMKRFFHEKQSLKNPNLDQQEGESLHNHLTQELSEYMVTLSSGEEIYILAADPMDAAYSALELSMDRNTKLINVRITDEW